MSKTQCSFLCRGKHPLSLFPFNPPFLVSHASSSPHVPVVIHGVYRHILRDGSGHAAGRLSRQILPTPWIRRRPARGLGVSLPGARWQRERSESPAKEDQSKKPVCVCPTCRRSPYLADLAGPFSRPRSINASGVRLLGALRVWRVARLMNTLLLSATEAHDQTIDTLRQAEKVRKLSVAIFRYLTTMLSLSSLIPEFEGN